MYCIAIISTPIPVQQSVLMALVHRSPGHEVHTLNQCTLDMMLDHKVCKLVSGADSMIVCPQYEQSADSQSVALNISYGLHDFVSAAFLVIQRKRFIVNKLNPDRQLHKTCLLSSASISLSSPTSQRACTVK